MTDTVFVTGLCAPRLSRRHAARGQGRTDLQARPRARHRPDRGVALRQARATPWAMIRSWRSRAEAFCAPPLSAGRGRRRRGRRRRARAVPTGRTACGSRSTSRMRRSPRPLPMSGSRSARRRQMAEALVALGGNVGNVRATLDRAVAAFCDGREVRLLARSSDYRTPPWGVEDQPAFVNLCIAVETEADATCAAGARASGRARVRARPCQGAALGPAPGRYRPAGLRRHHPGRAGPDAAAPAAVRARLRAGAARRDRARPGDRRHAHGATRWRGSTPRASKSCRRDRVTAAASRAVPLPRCIRRRLHRRHLLDGSL